MKKLLYVVVVLFEIFAWIAAINGMGTINLGLGWATFFFAVSWNARAALTSIAQDEINKALE